MEYFRIISSGKIVDLPQLLTMDDRTRYIRLAVTFRFVRLVDGNFVIADQATADCIGVYAPDAQGLPQHIADLPVSAANSMAEMPECLSLRVVRCDHCDTQDSQSLVLTACSNNETYLCPIAFDEHLIEGHDGSQQCDDCVGKLFTDYIKDRLEDGGGSCPWPDCESSDLETHFDSDTDHVRLCKVECNACGRGWTERWTDTLDSVWVDETTRQFESEKPETGAVVACGECPHANWQHAREGDFAIGQCYVNGCDCMEFTPTTI